jgi:DNA topoisomerase IB
VPRLRRSDCSAPGIGRRRRGRGFELLDPAGERIDDPEVRARVDALAIPPAWRDVWICLDPLGHLQATGVDAAGRKQYVKEITGGDFSAKDFRTWNATVLAAVALAGEQERLEERGRASTKTSRRRAVGAAVKAVAAYLGNTPAVCRASYVDPRVIDRFHSGDTIAPTLRELGGKPDLARPGKRAGIEAAVLDLLADAPD